MYLQIWIDFTIAGKVLLKDSKKNVEFVNRNELSNTILCNVIVRTK